MTNQGCLRTEPCGGWLGRCAICVLEGGGQWWSVVFPVEKIMLVLVLKCVGLWVFVRVHERQRESRHPKIAKQQTKQVVRPCGKDNVIAFVEMSPNLLVFVLPPHMN